MFLPSTAGLPQNSLDPPTAQEVQRTNRERYKNFMTSRTGRERVYATLPPVESFVTEGMWLAKDAQTLTSQSEMARRSVLNGLVPLRGANNATAVAATPAGSTVSVAAPRVVSLNAPPTSHTMPTISAPSQSVQPQTGLMPAQAPMPANGFYLDPGAGDLASQAAMLPVINTPPGASAQLCGGMGGFTPPWSDAFLTVTGSQAATSQNDPSTPFVVLGVLLLAAWGLSALAKEEKKAA